MTHFYHDFSELFAQLGLSNDQASIRSYIANHSSLPSHVRIEEAAFWTPAQAQMLREELIEDADWAELVDQLSVALR
jgi:hypothetical protein